MSNTVKEVTLSKRGLRMLKKTKQDLDTIAASGSLSAAAARFELLRRQRGIRVTNA